MKCRELLEMLGDYVDGTLDPGLCAGFESHLSGCSPCQIVIDNVRKTITIYKNGEPVTLPVEFRRRLHDELRKRWKA